MPPALRARSRRRRLDRGASLPRSQRYTPAPRPVMPRHGDVVVRRWRYGTRLKSGATAPIEVRQEPSPGGRRAGRLASGCGAFARTFGGPPDDPPSRLLAAPSAPVAHATPITIRHRDDRPRQGLRTARPGGPGSPTLDPPGRGVWPARAERRRQDDHPADAAGPGPPDVRERLAHGLSARRSCRSRAGRGADRDSRLLSPPLGPAQSAGPGEARKGRVRAGRRGPPPSRPREPGRRPVRDLLAGHEAASWHCGG